MAVNHAHQYPQVVGTPSERSDRDLWNHINRYIWGKSGAESSPTGNWNAEPYAIRPLIDINTTQIKKQTQIVNESLSSAKTHRDNIESKINKHLIGHNGNSGECPFWDIPCKLNKISGTLGMVAVSLVAGVIVYKVIIKPKVRKRKK